MGVFYTRDDLVRARAQWRRAGKTVVFTHHQHLPILHRMMKSKFGGKFDERFHPFDDNDRALEWCENQLLAKHGHSRSANGPLKAEDYELLRGFTAAELEIVRPLLRSHSFHGGQAIITAGAAAREIFFLSRGTVSVCLHGGEHQRLASFSPGMCFGEMAFIDGAPRSADIIADTDVECHSLGLDDYTALGESRPALKIKLLEQLCLDLTRKLRKANRELDVLD